MSMILLDNLLIHDDLLKEAFTCDLNACKGACCREGEFGAPLEEEEEKTIESILDTVVEYLPETNRKKIEEDGISRYYEDMEKVGTQLMQNGACVFLIENQNGPGKCAFEKAWEDRKIEFRKPISCHLYPVRIEKNEGVGLEYLNYDRWEICLAACNLGRKLKMPVFEFCSEALERKYGPGLLKKLRELKDAVVDDKQQ